MIQLLKQNSTSTPDTQVRIKEENRTLPYEYTLRKQHNSSEHFTQFLVYFSHTHLLVAPRHSSLKQRAQAVV
jgi:hypothetical protein